AVAAGASTRLSLVIGLATLLAGMIVTLITYLLAERLVRPVAASALARRFEDSTLEPPITQRLRMTWVMTTALPLIGILLIILGQRQNFFTEDAAEIIPAVVALAVAALVTGFVGTSFAIMSVVDPIL